MSTNLLDLAGYVQKQGDLGRQRGQQDRYNGLARTAASAYGPQRDQAIADMAGIDPTAAQTFGTNLQKQDDDYLKKASGGARFVVQQYKSGGIEAARAAYRYAHPSFDRAARMNGQSAPPELDESVIPKLEMLASVYEGTGGEVPGAFRALDMQARAAGYQPGTPEYQKFMRVGVTEARPSSAAISYKEVIGADGVRRLVAMDPREVGATIVGAGDPALTGPGLQEEEAMKARGKAQVEFQYAPVTAAATEGAKIDAQVARAPQVAQAEANAAGMKAGAEAAVKTGVERADRSRANAEAYAMYQQARVGLERGLNNATTGPIVGRLPALTTEQQIAQGGVDTMAPVLKQLFRTAGEGAFTDRDQALLLGMIPTRNDTKEARAAKLRNIDNIVAAKLGRAPAGTKPPSAPKQVKRTGMHNGRRVVQYTDGSIEYAD